MPILDTFLQHSFLCHHGIKGMKWGVRRYQNKDGSLTEEGKLRLNLKNVDNTFSKGLVVSRVSTKPYEPVLDFRKYVSLQNKAEDKWINLYKNYYGYAWEHIYETTKDIKVSSIKTNINAYKKLVRDDPGFLELAKDAAEEHRKQTGISASGDDMNDFFKSLAVPTEGSKKYMNYMNMKYDAIADKFGIESGGNRSVIILEPHKTLQFKKAILRR